MAHSFKKNKGDSVFYKLLFKFGAVLIIIVAIFLVIADARVYRKKQQLNLQIESLKNKIQDLEDKNNNFKQGISNADSNQYMEKVAREELDLQKPGEKVVSFVVTQKEPSQNSNEQKNFLQVWLANVNNFWNWITGKP